jgi:hypothetical protein
MINIDVGSVLLFIAQTLHYLILCQPETISHKQCRLLIIIHDRSQFVVIYFVQMREPVKLAISLKFEYYILRLLIIQQFLPFMRSRPCCTEKMVYNYKEQSYTDFLHSWGALYKLTSYIAWYFDLSFLVHIYYYI